MKSDAIAIVYEKNVDYHIGMHTNPVFEIKVECIYSDDSCGNFSIAVSRKIYEKIKLGEKLKFKIETT